MPPAVLGSAIKQGVVMKKEVDAIAVDKWSVGYDLGTDSAILSFEFEDADEPLALSMSRDLAGLIAIALNKVHQIEAPKPEEN